jgi:hypothetical protein
MGRVIDMLRAADLLRHGAQSRRERALWASRMEDIRRLLVASDAEVRALALEAAPRHEPMALPLPGMTDTGTLC